MYGYIALVYYALTVRMSARPWVQANASRVPELAKVHPPPAPKAVQDDDEDGEEGEEDVFAPRRPVIDRREGRDGPDRDRRAGRQGREARGEIRERRDERRPERPARFDDADDARDYDETRRMERGDARDSDGDGGSQTAYLRNLDRDHQPKGLPKYMGHQKSRLGAANVATLEKVYEADKYPEVRPGRYFSPRHQMPRCGPASRRRPRPMLRSILLATSVDAI